MKKIAIIYHADCPDGFGGAWAAWKKFGSKAEYIPAQHGTLPPASVKSREVYLIDFVYPEAITKRLIAHNTRVTAIDHHISAEKVTKLTAHYSYALNHSGAVLAWNYFHKTPAPLLLRYVEDTDLWRFVLPHSKEISSFLQLFEYEFSEWSVIAQQLASSIGRKKIIEQGRLILRYEDKLVKDLVKKNAELVSFFGIKALAVNSPKFESQIGHELVKKMSPLGIVWRKKAGEIRVSLRSNDKVDVSKLASRIAGGGGHKRAAGFAFKFNPGKKFPWRYL